MKSIESILTFQIHGENSETRKYFNMICDTGTKNCGTLQTPFLVPAKFPIMSVFLIKLETGIANYIIYKPPALSVLARVEPYTLISILRK